MKTKRWLKIMGMVLIVPGLLRLTNSHAQPSYTTNDLWLQVIGLTNASTPDGTASLKINTPWDVTNGIYDLFATTNLAPGGWGWVMRTAAGQTNLTVTGLPSQSKFFILGSTLPAGDGSGLTVAYENLVGVAILTQPGSQTVVETSNATFSVTAAGIVPLSYQWYFNSAILVNATNATLIVSNVQASNAGTYFVVARNSIGAMTSSNAVLTVLASGISISSPQNNTVFAASPTNIILQASTAGIAGNPTVQFFQGAISLGIVTNSPYSLVWSNATAGNYGLTAVAMGNGLAVTSPVVNITVTPLFATNTMRLWLKADAMAGLTNNASVTNWPDQSGWGNDATQSSVSNRPSFVTNAVNGRPVIRFNGTNSYFTLPSLMNGTTGAEAYVVLKAAAANPPASQALWRFGSGPSGLAPGYPNPDGSIADNFCGNNVMYNFQVPSQVQPLTQYHVYQVSAQSNSWAAWVNGMLQFQTAANSYLPNASPLLGRSTYFDGNNTVSLNFYGDIAEVLIFSRTLTADDRTTVAAYLNGKYGLITTMPMTPTNLLATAIATNQVSLTWDETLTGGATLISVERSTASGGPYAEVARVADSLSCVDTNGLMAGTTYYYRVRAINLNMWSGYSTVDSTATLATGAGLPFDNLSLWLKADQGGAQGTTNTPINYWLDQSGHGNNAYQSSAANWPQWIPNAIGDRPMIRFDGTNGYFFLPTFMNSATAGEALVVLRTTTTNSFHSLWQMGSDINGRKSYPDTDGTINDNFGTSAVKPVGMPPQPLTQYHVYDVTSQPGNWKAEINGVRQYQTSNNTVDFTTGTETPSLGYAKYDTGGFNLADSYFAGDIAEVLVFNRGLTVDEKSAAESYLNHKYSLSNVVPTAPLNLTATALSLTQVGITWVNMSPVLADVQIERKTDTAGIYSTIAQVGPGVTNFTDATLISGHMYFYRVRASNIAGKSPYSNEAVATINQLPSVSLTSPTNGAVFFSHSDIQLAATASDDGTVTNVVFFVDGTTNLGASANPPYGLTWSNVPAGIHSLTAVATDNLGYFTNSSPVFITICNPPPTISIASPTNNALFQAPGTIPLAVNVGDANGTVVKVEYFYGATNKIGESVASPFDLVWGGVPAGTNSITAKATDDEGAATTSSAVKAIVNAQPSVSITNPVNNAALNSGENITINATASDSDGTISQVDFYYGSNQLIGSDTTAPFSIVFTNAPSGTYSLTAKATDNRGGVTLSSPVTITVSTNLGDIADSYVDRSSPTSNFGTIDPLLLQTNGATADTDVYFMFDTSGITNVIGAKLNIYAAVSRNNSTVDVTIYGTGTNWTETGITWNNRPVLGTNLGSTNISGGALTLYALDVTSYVQAQKALGNDVIGLAIHATTSTSWFASVNSKEASSNKPFLQIFTTNGLP